MLHTLRPRRARRIRNTAWRSSSSRSSRHHSRHLSLACCHNNSSTTSRQAALRPSGRSLLPAARRVAACTTSLVRWTSNRLVLARCRLLSTSRCTERACMGWMCWSAVTVQYSIATCVDCAGKGKCVVRVNCTIVLMNVANYCTSQLCVNVCQLTTFKTTNSSQEDNSKSRFPHLSHQYSSVRAAPTSTTTTGTLIPVPVSRPSCTCETTSSVAVH